MKVTFWKVCLSILIIFLLIGININISESTSISSVNDPEYSKIFEVNQVDDILDLGDIIFFDAKPFLKKKPFNVHSNPGYSNDHCALYIGNNWFIEAVDYSTAGVGCGLLKNGVQFTHMWLYRVWGHNFTYARVINASFFQKIKACTFHVKQLGEPYQYAWAGFDDYMSWHCNPDIKNPFSPYYYPEDPYRDYWFCSEIIWASYLHQGINLDSTPDPALENDGNFYYCVGVNDIRESNNIIFIER